MRAKTPITQAGLRFVIAALLATAAMLALAAPAGASFGLANWDGVALSQQDEWNEEPPSWDEKVPLKTGEVATQAGSHPYSVSTSFSLTTTVLPFGGEWPTEFLKDAIAELPPGMLGNPQAVARCPIADLREGAVNKDSGGGAVCSRESQVGVLILTPSRDGGTPYGGMYPLFNLMPPPGVPALLGFEISSVPVFLAAKLRSDGDYGVTLTSLNANQTLPFKDFTFEIWGVPADPSHDEFRNGCFSEGAGLAEGRKVGNFTGKKCPSPDWPDNANAFLDLPTACIGPTRWDLTVRGWEGGEDRLSFLSHDTSVPPVPVGNTGCGALDFSPTLEARPTTNVADAPSGLKVDLHIPQDNITDPESVREADLKDTTVTLPKGLAINPSGANGLGACTPFEIGLTTPVGQSAAHFTESPQSCPDSAKVGSAQVDTPLLDHPAKGSLYIASPHQNPFGSLLALYLVIEDPQSGTVAKLAGVVHANPQTGQLSSTFEENPQLPLEDVKLDIPGGAYAPLKTPNTCGTYETTSSLTPWSAPEGETKHPSDTYAISQGRGGGCPTQEAQMPNSPSFDAGTVAPLAGHYSPFVLNLRREDGSQRFSAIGLTPPQGLLAKLAGTTRCSEAALTAATRKTGQQEKANPSCAASSHVGEVVAAAGAGPAPFYAQGEAYLAGSYEGAPISLAILTPATAGPFDLGTILTRTALHIDPATAQIDATSDPIPQILEGIPLNIRSVQVKLDRPGFTLNPTSCEPSQVKGTEISALGQIATLQSRFQLAECTRLGFKPKISFSLKGGTKRGDHPALITILKPRSGDANLASISVALPRSEFLDQAHIGTVCTRVQWAADACPPASVYGSVSVQTPLLDQPLSGNVYLRSSDNLLPDLVPDLRGPADLPIRFEAAGRTDSIHGGIRSTFSFVPDAPFTKLVVKLKGQKKGLLENSRDICAKDYRVTVKYGAHNGLALTEHPMLKAGCKQKRAKKHKAKQRQRRAAR